MGMGERQLRMSNVVHFEIPAFVDIDELSARIRSRWPGSKERVGDIWLISARVRRNKTDLALLLREIEAYVAHAGLQAIRYHLDRRCYIMEARILDGAAFL